MKGSAKYCIFFYSAIILKVVPFNDVGNTFYIMENFKVCFININLISNCSWLKMNILLMQNFKYGRDRGWRHKISLLQYLLYRKMRNSPQIEV